MGRPEYCNILFLRHSMHMLDDIPAARRIQSHRRFIQQQHFGLVQQGPSYFDAAPMPAVKLPHLFGLPLQHSESSEFGFHAFARVFFPCRAGPHDRAGFGAR